MSRTVVRRSRKARSEDVSRDGTWPMYLGSMPMYFVTSPELTHRVLVTDAASFGKGAMFEKFRPFVGNGPVTSGGAFHLRQAEDMRALAVTIVGEALFGTEFGKSAISEVPVVIKQGMIRALSPAFVAKPLVRGNRQFDRAVARMRDVVRTVIADWRASGTDRGDPLSMPPMARDDGGEGMTDQQAYYRTAPAELVGAAPLGTVTP